MEYFFRHNEDKISSLNMSLVRLGLIFILILLLTYRKREKLLKISLILALFVQGLLIFWYFGDKDLFLKEGLPFYHCRIATFMMAYFHFRKNNKLSLYFAYLGILGTTIAFLLPDPSKYIWPHLTNITYVASHYLLVINGVMLIGNTREKLEFYDILKTSLWMNMIICLVNIVFVTNYGYLNYPPESINLSLSMPLLYILSSFLISMCIFLFDKCRQEIFTRRFFKILAS